MIAKLVLWSPMVRVIVEDDATYEDIIAAAKYELDTSLSLDYENHIEEVLNDEQMPYDPAYDKLTPIL